MKRDINFKMPNALFRVIFVVLSSHRYTVDQIEQVQRRAARWTVSNFDRKASVTKMVQDLGWRTLDQRRADARLCFFF